MSGNGDLGIFSFETCGESILICDSAAFKKNATPLKDYWFSFFDKFGLEQKVLLQVFISRRIFCSSLVRERGNDAPGEEAARRKPNRAVEPLSEIPRRDFPPVPLVPFFDLFWFKQDDQSCASAGVGSSL
jgi:hypothetical protein